MQLLLSRLLPILFFSFCLLSGEGLSAQYLHQEFYSLDQGLSTRTVTDIELSKEGVVWVATTNGLNRFDGYRFESYTEDESSPPHRRLSAKSIDRIYETVGNNLIILYDNHSAYFDIFDPITNEITKVEFIYESAITGHPVDITVDNRGLLYLVTCTDSTTQVFTYVGDTFQHKFTIEDTWDNELPVLEMLPLSDGSFLFFDEEHGLRQIDARGRVQQRYDMGAFNRPTRAERGKKSLYFLRQGTNGKVYISFYNQPGLYCSDKSVANFALVPEVDRSGYYIDWEQDKKGNILITRGEPLGKFPRTTGLYCIKHTDEVIDFDHLLGVSDYIIATASNDYFRTIFFGIDTGMKIVQNSLTNIKSFLREDLREFERGNVMRGICEDDRGYVYLAQEENYWFRLDSVYDYIDTLFLQDEETGRVIDFGCSKNLVFDPAGAIWGTSCTVAGSSSSRLHRYDLETCMTRTIPYEHRIHALTLGPGGNIWFGFQRDNPSEVGIATYNTRTGIFTKMLRKDQNAILPDGSTPRYLYFDQSDLLWIGTENGLFRYHTTERSVTAWNVRDADSQQLFSDNIFHVIHEDSTGHLWLGTDNGLNIFNPATNENEVYTEADGLAHNTVVGIQPDAEGRYWISTFNGLSYYQPDSARILRYYRSDGLNNDEFTFFSFQRDWQGRLIFGGVNGFNVFFPQDLLQYRETPSVVLTRVSKFNTRTDSTTVQTDRLSDLNRIVLEPSDKFFDVEFALPVYTRTDRNVFRIRLNDHEEEWRYLGNQHSYTYNNLPSGNYTLLIEGADPNGNWSRLPLSIPVTVKEIWHKRTWFRVLVLLVLALFIWFLGQRRLRAKLREEHLRMRLSSDLHDEVSGLLGGIAMQSDLLAMQTEDTALKDRVQTIGKVSRKAMTKMSDVIWSIDSRKDKVGDLLNRMQQHADDVLLPVDIRYSFKVERLEKDKLMPANVRQDIYFFFVEAINNIAKHARADHVSIRVGNEGSQFVLLIQDNGIGEATEATNHSGKSGQGISNLYMRAQRLHADLNIDRQNGYTISLRMKKFA